ncbi:MAG: translation initiation factor IF-3 [Proteobacteria bacterium]|jgi:translation initiation factor IF-3|nr:translation initiation factor IF-3 [Pseudomonadota bacterium]
MPIFTNALVRLRYPPHTGTTRSTKSNFREAFLRRGPRRRFRPEPDQNELRTNRRIRAPRVLVIDEEGKKLGEFLIEDAVRLAEDRGLDLVEVARNSRPPVCKIADYGRLKYEKSKRDALARKNQVQQQLKEVKVRPKTDDHDLDVKVRHSRRFLDEGNKVKVTVRFRGRELAHRDIGTQQCLLIAKQCEDLGIIESHPRMDGRQMFMIMAPTKRPQPKSSTKKARPKKTDADGREITEEVTEEVAEVAEEVTEEVAEVAEEVTEERSG